MVFVTKYRCADFLVDQLEFLKGIFESVCQDFNADLLEMKGERDHVHLLANFPPNVSVSKLVNSLKGVSSRILRKQAQAEAKNALDPACGHPHISPKAAAKLHSRLSRHTSRMRGSRLGKNRSLSLRPEGRSFMPQLGKPGWYLRYFGQHYYSFCP